ncbi:MAG: pentapeptide repeat-containing protein [Thainema sp.]
MPQDFSNCHLQGCSFRGQDLTGADFSGANIRGADFSNAVLIGTNFQQVKAGQQRHWALGLVLGIVLLAFLGGYILGWLSGAISSVMLGTQDQPLAFWSGISACLVLLGEGTILVRRGLGAALGIFIISVPTITIVAVAFSQTQEQRTLAAFLVFQLLNAAAAIAAVITGSTAIAIDKTILGRRPVPFTLTALVVGTIAGMWEGIEFDEHYHLTQAIPLGGLIAVGLTSLSVYIGSQTVLENPRYILIRRLATVVTASGGTCFRFANLTDADFTQASLNSSDFRNAILKRTCWFGVRHLKQARTENTYLADSQVAQLVITKDGYEQIFDRKDLRGLNLEGANLKNASFIGSDLSGSTLKQADLSNAKLVQTQLSRTNLSSACLTGAYIQNWGISTDTQLADVRCDYIYMQLPTPTDPDPCRKPDNKQETFRSGDFETFISPIIKTLDLYQQQNVDPRRIAKAYKTIDLFHHEGLDPTAAAVALKQLAEQYPEAGLEVVALEGRGDEKIRLQTRVTGQADRSQLSAEYFAKYWEAAALPYSDLQALLAAITEKDQRIRSLESMVMTAMQSDKIYVETYYDLGNRQDTLQSAKIILVLAANPKGTRPLRLGEEVKKIQTGLERSKYRESFHLEQRWAVTVTDVRRALLDCHPQIVHFCGHGVGVDAADNALTSTRKFTIVQDSAIEPEGLMFEDETGQSKLVSATAIAALFALFSDQIECVVLNACYSDIQADAIVQHIPYVVGMNQSIGNQAAIEFAVGFYDALLAGQSIKFAYDMGCSAIQMAGIPENLTPVLHRKAF